MQGTQTVNAAGDAPGQTAAEARLQRNLKIVVVALGVLIFAGLATAVGRIIYLASAKPTQPVASASSVPLSSTASLALPAGAQVRSISLSGDRLAVHYEASGAEGVAVIDLATGQPVASVGITRSAPR